MNLLDRLLHHDYSTTRTLLELSVGLSDAQLDQEFDLGYRTLRKTFEHVVRNVEGWSLIMRGEDWPGLRQSVGSIGGLLDRLDEAYPLFARFARDIDERYAWDEKWFDRFDDPPHEKTYGGAIAHLITHSMHHRAQLLFMLRRLGVENVPEGDALSSENDFMKPS